jgi:hypothetical protein
MSTNYTKLMPRLEYNDMEDNAFVNNQHEKRILPLMEYDDMKLGLFFKENENISNNETNNEQNNVSESKVNLEYSDFNLNEQSWNTFKK